MRNTSNSEKVDGALGMSSWRNRRAPSLSDNTASKLYAHRLNSDDESTRQFHTQGTALESPCSMNEHGISWLIQ